MGRQKAFSLTELLVVLAILAVLCGLLFPVFASARERGRAATCLSNVGQLARATLLYTTENDEKLPSVPWLVPLGLATRKQVSVENGRIRFVQDPTLTCPAYHPPNGKDGEGYGGYAMNDCLNFTIAHEAQSSLVLIAESAALRGTSTLDGSSWENETFFRLVEPDVLQVGWWSRSPGYLPVEPIGSWGARRHHGRGNYSFVDGHAKSVSEKEFYVPQDSEPCGRLTTPVSGMEDRLRFAPTPFGSLLHRGR